MGNAYFFQGKFPRICVRQLLVLHEAILLDEFDLERSNLLTHGSFKVGKGLTGQQRDLVDQDIRAIHTKEEWFAMATARDSTANLRTVRSRLAEVDNDAQRYLRNSLGDRLRRVLCGGRRYRCAGSACRQKRKQHCCESDSGAAGLIHIGYPQFNIGFSESYHRCKAVSINSV